MQVRAYNAWTAAKQLGRERAYAAAHFLSGGTMAMIEGMRGQLLGELTVRLFRLSIACPYVDPLHDPSILATCEPIQAPCVALFKRGPTCTSLHDPLSWPCVSLFRRAALWRRWMRHRRTRRTRASCAASWPLASTPWCEGPACRGSTCNSMQKINI